MDDLKFDYVNKLLCAAMSLTDEEEFEAIYDHVIESIKTDLIFYIHS